MKIQSLRTCTVDEEDSVSGAHIYGNYLYDAATQEISPQGLRTSYSYRGSAAVKKRSLESGQIQMS
jgi:hypothetical protein